MKKKLLITIATGMLCFSSIPASAADIDSMSVEELKDAYRELEAKYNSLAGVENNDDATSVPTADMQSWKEGMYKVGADIPAGEYVLISSGGGYFEICTDSSGSFDSIVANGNFDTNSIITVSDGMYLEFTRADAYAIDSSPELDTSKEGMFKIGKHIPAGEYKIHSDDSGYVQVSSDSSQTFESIVSNDNFAGDSYITLSDGQYLTLSRACIVQ